MISRWGHRWGLLTALGCIVMLAGCGGGPSLVKVTGKVLVDGLPADGAVLLFHPQSSENTTVSTAIADANGSSPVTGDNAGIPRVVTVSRFPGQTLRAGSGRCTANRNGSFRSAGSAQGEICLADKTSLTVVISRSTTELEPFELSAR